MAAQNNNKEVAKVLIGQGANVNTTNKNREAPFDLTNEKETKALLMGTALLQAIEKGNTEIANALIDQGADVNIQNNKGETPLHLTILEGHKEIVETLLKVEGIDVNKETGFENTPLHWAVDKGNVEIVETLLKVEGIDVNKKNKNGLLCIGLLKMAIKR